MFPQCPLHRQSSSALRSHTYQLCDTFFVNSDYVFTGLSLLPRVACEQGQGIFIYLVSLLLSTCLEYWRSIYVCYINQSGNCGAELFINCFDQSHRAHWWPWWNWDQASFQSCLLSVLPPPPPSNFHCIDWSSIDVIW